MNLCRRLQQLRNQEDAIRRDQIPARPEIRPSLIQSGKLKEHILLVQGGTTTFLAPALSMGAIGVITMSGAPESHLGILSREFQMPCVMTAYLVGSDLRYVTGGNNDAHFEAIVKALDGKKVRAALRGPRDRPRSADRLTSLRLTPLPSRERTMSTYKQRYEASDNGLRFQDLVYQGNFKGMDPVPDGILGDKIMRSRAKSKVLEKVSKEDVLRDQFTVDELNDLNNYLAWNIWDVLVMRATEGVSGMIPRQEYEILAFMQEFYRWPEILQMTTDEIGAKGVMDIGASARREIGTKVNCVHDWCIGAVGFGMGRCGLLALEAIQPQDFVRESNTILKFMQRVLWGKRQDGYILNSQDRYRCQIHEKDVIEKLKGELEYFEHGSDAHDTFVRFNAAAELLSFLDHYDCRLGLGDTGPYPLRRTARS